MFDITVMGNAAVDVLVNVTDDFLTSHNLRKGDFQTLARDEFEALAAECAVDSMQSGGSTANTAWTMAELGQKVAFIGRVGDDHSGRHFYGDMQKAGVDMPEPDATVNTMEIYVLITPDGQRTFASRGVSAPVRPNMIDEEIIKNSKWLLLEGYMMFDQMDALDQAILLARKHDTKIALTLSALFVVEGCFDNLASEVLKGMDLIIANDEEMDEFIRTAEHHSHTEAVKIAQKIMDAPRVITSGGGGATFVVGEEKISMSCKNIESPVDTTGAGDAFAAGFMHVYVEDSSNVEKALGLGHLLAHSVIQQVGGRLHLIQDHHREAAIKVA